jgi:hypothetical protein
VRAWVRLPTDWIRQKSVLSEFVWGRKGEGANNVAALMSLIAVAHAANDDTGVARMTYDDLSDVTSLSRAKLAKGLDVLRLLSLVEEGQERSHFKLGGYDKARGWGKLPARKMYSGGRIEAFSHFKLRQRAELDALKMFLVFVAFRGEDINAANLSYDGIEKWAGVSTARIKSGLSILTTLEMVRVDRVPKEGEMGIRHRYRLVGVEDRRHLGTSGRQSL